MPDINHKAVRRALLRILYDTYLADPLCMVEPERFFESPIIDRVSIVPNMHYLADRKLVEMMMGYRPPMFSAARITAAGIDLVENRFEFDRQFPAAPLEGAGALGAIPLLLEELVAQGDLAPIHGDARRQLLSDILYLRDELSRPVNRWRAPLIHAVLDAAAAVSGCDAPQNLARLRQAVDTVLEKRAE